MARVELLGDEDDSFQRSEEGSVRDRMPTEVALIGLGRWGRRLVPGLVDRFNLRVACTLDNPAPVEWLRTHYPSVGHTWSLDSVLADAAIDAVVVATPIETHAAIAARALELGKNVFVEKPLATTVEDAGAVVALADRSGRILFVGHTLLYDPALVRLLAASGKDPAKFARLSWRKLGTLDSDLFWNVASHFTSVALVLFGEQPVDVSLLAAEGVLTECDIAVVHLTFSEGRHAIIDLDRVAPNDERCVAVVSERGTLRVWRDGTLHELFDGRFAPAATGDRRALDVELDAFRAAVEEGAPFPSDGAHAAAVVEAVVRIRSLAAASR
jgi:UDP-2-acetamido-3-amino-2,3-dideoxy-glucuronate N-acetyltransferase